MFPSARIIHCQRSPIATCFSCYSTLFTQGQEFTYDLEELAHYYLAYRNLMQHWHGMLPDKIYEPNYENLVTSQEKETRALLDFCQLEWDDNCMDYYKNKRTVLSASHSQVNRPIYTTSLDSWKRYEQELQPLVNILKTQIEL